MSAPRISLVVLLTVLTGTVGLIGISAGRSMQNQPAGPLSLSGDWKYLPLEGTASLADRSEERRVGKEC